MTESNEQNNANRDGIARLMIQEAFRKLDHQERRVAFFRKSAAAIAAAHVSVASIAFGTASKTPGNAVMAVVVSVVAASAAALRVNSPIKKWFDGPVISSEDETKYSMDTKLYDTAIPLREANRSLAITISEGYRRNECKLKKRLWYFNLLVVTVLVGQIALITSIT